MAHKRTASEDLESSPPALKQPRLMETPPIRPSSLPTPQSFIVPTQRPPLQHIARLPGSPRASLVNMTTGVVSQSAAVMRPGILSLQSPPVPLRLPASYSARMGPPTVPVMCPTIAPQRRPILSTSVMTPSPIPLIPPPPYSVSMVMPPASESLQEQADNTCLSPSQFLYHPATLQSTSTPSSTTASPTVVTSTVATSSDSNRQPVCTSAAIAIVNVSKGKENGKMNIKDKRAKVLKAFKKKSAILKLKHEVQLKEKFFLEGGGNLMDFLSWKKKPNILRDQYLDKNELQSGGAATNQDQLVSPKDMTQSFIPRRTPAEEVLKESPKQPLKQPGTLKDSKSPEKFKTLPSTAPKTDSSSTTIQIPLSTVSPASIQTGTPKQLTPASPKSSNSFQTPSPRPSTRTQASFSSVYESSHEDIVMRARHEADVKKAIAELRREGLWSACRLPKVVEPSRKKTQWDYLLEEMQWLATDFVNEKKWKINAAKKLSRSVARYHQEKDMQHARAEKEDQLRLKKIASTIAKEIKHFWDSIQKVVEHKQQVLLEEKRKRAMDLHLDYIVDQTTKYSKWLVKGLASATSSAEPSLQSAASSSLNDSDDFVAGMEESDNEETMDREEEALNQEGVDYGSELRQLQNEADLPLDQLLDSLPPEMLASGDFPTPTPSVSDEAMEVEALPTEDAIVETVTSPRKEPLLEKEPAGDDDKADDIIVGEASVTSDPCERVGGTSGEGSESSASREGGDEDEYRASGDECDEEGTISEQEDHEGEQDHRTEMDDLAKEGELPLEDLLARYNLQRQSNSPETDVEEPSEGTSPMETSGNVSEEEGAESEEEEAGLELLVSGKSIEEACQTEAGLSDVAAVAKQFQPKGITLATTEVKTPVPFLLRHTLREYQHIGLDWLVAMHDRKLNGILADEMGLGKTIQTIALLAHLACEKGNWGPHLIIVPTSVMLNWELELKKWSPAFKILTYFGTLKERKQKRVGWSKKNAFHVCITSYNIAVTDHRSFKQKKWKYIILDEAQHIKNFKSQRWQTLLNFNSQRRLLLTGTPLQNSLMELWSLMHFLMPAVFSSHSDFKEWFSNPLTGMVEGSQEYNASIVKRLHQVLRPFLLHRRKMEVEKQMPQKYEHLIPCQLSKRQRFLYDDYMSRAKTKDSLASGNYLSVINILMQLRKVCNHPDLFELRPIVSPLRLLALEYYTASLVLQTTSLQPFQNVSLDFLNLQLADYEVTMDAFVAYRSRQLQAPRLLILDPTHPQGVMESEGCDSGDDREGEGYLEDLHLPTLQAKIEEFTLSRRRQMCEVNSRRCKRQPVYGRDLVEAVRGVCHPGSSCSWKASSRPPTLDWRWSGHSACLRHQTSSLSWTEQSTLLAAALPSLEERLDQLSEVIKRFVITVPRVTAPSIKFHTYHPPLAYLTHEQLVNKTLTTGLSRPLRVLHQTSTAMCFQFPETRLIQYDCGKLQTLHLLLQRLKNGSHRALIFTQMGRVLDVLEIFLNYHGHTYLRLDGSTPVIKRQQLMERFNRDERVFCFILSTRSGGLGVNLTGADTVIFYDSDWNPTMDAQAQDRCHRIGQTRDVHIYRLICTSTVEENILKKANQKKMLGHIAIEGGGFTTDFFKQESLRELFKVKSHETTPPKSPSIEDQSAISEKQVEEMLMSAEDEGDAQAAAEARAEQAAELAEFDEAYAAHNDGSQESVKEGEGEKIRSEFAAIDEQLNNVERYAMRYLEEENAGVAAEQLKQAEESIEHAKKEWELGHLKSLRQEEERLADEDTTDDILLSYDRPDNSNKVYFDEPSGEEMPVWLPPTPPADDNNDHYVDIVMDMSYDTHTTISPAILAAIAPFSEEDYDVFGLSKKTTQYDIVKKSQRSSIKQQKEHLNVPPSLFWRRPAADALSTKLKKLASHQKKLKAKDQFTPLLEQHPEGPDWMFYEDWALLKSVTVVLEFPLSLTITVPAQTPNWSVVADITSSLSRIRRSPLQCREHLMNVVIPREDHTLKHDEHEGNTKKMKSRDGTTKKTKGRREQRTKSLVVNDGGKEQGRLYSTCFDWIQQSSAKRKQAPKFTWESSQKPSMHTDLLKEYGIVVDTVHSPMQVAQLRADRIQVTRGNYHPGAAGTVQFKNAADLAKAGGYNVPRQTVTVAGTSGKFPSATTPTAASPSKLPAATPISLPLVTPISTSTVTGVTPIVSTAAVGKTTYTVPVSVSELGKTLIARSGLTHQQLLLLRQQTIQHQQQQAAAASLVSPTITQAPQTQSAKATLQQKIIPTGIEQLRTSVSSVGLPLQRFSGVATSGGTSAAATLRGLTGGRALQTEEVLALLKQQSLRMAATQQLKTAAGTAQIQPRDPATAIAQIQLRPEGTAKTVKQQLSAAILQGETAKLINRTTSGTSEAANQIKVEMIDTSRALSATQKTQAMKLVPATVAQSKVPAIGSGTTSVQQVTAAQFQQVLALQQAAAAAKSMAKPNTPATQTSTASTKPAEQSK